MKRGPRLDQEPDLLLETLNITNLVHHYREELELIKKGMPAIEVLDKGDRYTLFSRGILQVDKFNQRGTIVPWEVYALLERLKVKAY
ncbi:MAG: hypothetical protein JSV18_03665 [Candidatus Bathyarchaeota archaeon]|nr:MAG: hypothetical protein JSV18_03665 [Candidatus Bathyarchaeota archaeon]